MNGKLLLVAGCMASVALGSVAGQTYGQDKTSVPRRDFGKRMIERPLERTLAPSSALPGETNIDGALKYALAKGGAARGAAPKADFVNPKVAPGQVNWQPSLQAACASARTSGKPVLLFQMMGKLDDRFC